MTKEAPIVRPSISVEDKIKEIERRLSTQSMITRVEILFLLKELKYTRGLLDDACNIILGITKS